MSTSNLSQQRTLRLSLRQRRREIPSHERAELDCLINKSIQRSGIFLRSPYIASYFANDGEPSVNFTIQTCSLTKTHHYLPVIAKKKLKFSQYTFGDPLTFNAFNIAEPITTRRLAARLLSAILVPLVGFDKQGHRIGMGGGYYDRTLDFMRQKKCKKMPLLIGIAYACQEVDSIRSQLWDIPMDAIITEQGITCFSIRAQQLLRAF